MNHPAYTTISRPKRRFVQNDAGELNLLMSRAMRKIKKSGSRRAESPILRSTAKQDSEGNRSMSAADFLTTDVVLAREIEPKFPKQCVVCSQPNNNEFAEIRGETVGFSGFQKWLLRQSGKLKVPAHGQCSRKLKRRLFWRNIGVLTLATTLAVVWIAMEIYEAQIPFELNRLNLCIAVVVVFFPILILEEMYPPAFQFRVGEDNVTYEFKNRDYAKEFERLNEA